MKTVTARSLTPAFLAVALVAFPDAYAVAQSGVPSFLEVGKDYSLLMAGSTENEDFFNIRVVEIGTDGWFRVHEEYDEDEFFWINTSALVMIVDLQEKAELEAAERAEHESLMASWDSLFTVAAPAALRRLVHGQEAYYAEHGTYATHPGADYFISGNDVTVHIIAADSTGWNAIAINRTRGRPGCAVSVGTGPATSSEIPEGEIVCTES